MLSEKVGRLNWEAGIASSLGMLADFTKHNRVCTNNKLQQNQFSENAKLSTVQLALKSPCRHYSSPL